MSSAKLKRKNSTVKRKSKFFNELKTNIHESVKKHGIVLSAQSSSEDGSKISSVHKKLRVDDGKNVKNYPEVDNAVHLWFKDKLKKRMKVSESDLKKKAVEIALVVGIDDFECSNKWVVGFQRHFKVEKDRNGFLHQSKKIDEENVEAIVEGHVLNEDNIDSSCKKGNGVVNNTANLQPITFIDVDEIEECVDVHESKMPTKTINFGWMPEKADYDSDDDLLLGFDTHPSLLMPPDDDVSDTEDSFLGFGPCKSCIVKRSTYILKTVKKEEPIKLEEEELLFSNTVKADVDCKLLKKAIINIVPIKGDTKNIKSDGDFIMKDPLMQSPDNSIERRGIIKDIRTMQTIEPVINSPAGPCISVVKEEINKEQVLELNNWRISETSVMNNDVLSLRGTNEVIGEEIKNSWTNPEIGSNSLANLYVTNEVIPAQILSHNNIQISGSSFQSNEMSSWSVSDPLFINNGIPTSFIPNETLLKSNPDQNSWPVSGNSFGNNNSMNSFISNEVAHEKPAIENHWVSPNSSFENKDVTVPCDDKGSFNDTFCIPPIYEKYLNAMENAPFGSSGVANPSSGIVDSPSDVTKASPFSIINPSSSDVTNSSSSDIKQIDTTEPFTIYPIDPNLIKRESSETVVNVRRNDIIRFAVESMFKKSNSSSQKNKVNEIVDLTSDDETNVSSESKVGMSKSSKRIAKRISKDVDSRTATSQTVKNTNCTNISTSTTISATNTECQTIASRTKTLGCKRLGKSNVSISILKPQQLKTGNQQTVANISDVREIDFDDNICEIPKAGHQHSVTNMSDVQELDFDDDICEIKPRLLNNQNRKIINDASYNELECYKTNTASSVMSVQNTQYKRLTSKFFEKKLAQLSKNRNFETFPVPNVQNNNLFTSTYSEEYNEAEQRTASSSCPVVENNTLDENTAAEYTNICEDNSAGEVTFTSSPNYDTEKDSYQQPRIVSVVSLSSIGENMEQNSWNQSQEKINCGGENIGSSSHSITDTQVNSINYITPSIESLPSQNMLQNTKKCKKKNLKESVHSNNQSSIIPSPKQASKGNVQTFPPTPIKFNDSSTHIEQINMKQNIDYKKKRTGAVDNSSVIRKLDMLPGLNIIQNESILKKQPNVTILTLPSENNTVLSAGKNIQFIPISLLASSSNVMQGNKFNSVNEKLKSPKADNKLLQGNQMLNVPKLLPKDSTKGTIIPVKHNKHTSLISSINAALRNADSVVFVPLSKVLDGK